MSEAATLTSLWRAMAPRTVVAEAPPSVGEIAAAADAAGEARGRTQERAALEPLRAVFAAAEQALTAAAAIDADTLQPLFADLVTRVARAVVDAELRTGPDAIARLVSAALASIEIEGDPVLHLSAADAALLSGRHPGESRDPSPDAQMMGPGMHRDDGCGATIVIDPSLAPGEMRVETPRHVVAASLHARLAEIVAGL